MGEIEGCARWSWGCCRDGSELEGGAACWLARVAAAGKRDSDNRERAGEKEERKKKEKERKKEKEKEREIVFFFYTLKI